MTSESAVLRLVSYGSNYINNLIATHESLPYTALINNDAGNQGNLLSNFTAQTVEVGRPGAFPAYVRPQPTSLLIAATLPSVWNIAIVPRAS